MTPHEHSTEVQPAADNEVGWFFHQLRGREPWKGTVLWGVLWFVFAAALISPLPLLVVPVLVAMGAVGVPFALRITRGHQLAQRGVHALTRSWAQSRHLSVVPAEPDDVLAVSLGERGLLRVRMHGRDVFVEVFVQGATIDATTWSARNHRDFRELTQGTYTSISGSLLARMRHGCTQLGPISAWLPYDLRTLLETSMPSVFALTDGGLRVPSIEVNATNMETLRTHIDRLGWIGTRLVELTTMDDTVRALHVLRLEPDDETRIEYLNEWSLGLEDWVEETCDEWSRSGDGLSRAIAAEHLPESRRPRALIDLLTHPPAEPHVLSYVLALCAVDVPSHLSTWMLEVAHRDQPIVPTPDAYAVAMDIRQPPELLRPLHEAAPSPANAAQVMAWALLLGFPERALPESWLVAARASSFEASLDALELAAECVSDPALRQRFEAIADHVGHTVEVRLRSQLGALGLADDVKGAEWSIVEEG